MMVAVLCAVVAAFWSACNVAGCTAAQQHRAGEQYSALGTKALRECAFEPGLRCVLSGSDGWLGWLHCMAAPAVTCLGVQLVEAGAIGVGLGGEAILDDALRVQLAGAGPPRSPQLARAHACILALPEPTVAQCGDQPPDRCGVGLVEGCLVEAAVAGGAPVAGRAPEQ
jgi:hypothetical protein